METARLLEQGVQLMIFGMGTVFVFLTILVVLTTWMSSFLQKLAPPAMPTGKRGPPTTDAIVRSSSDTSTIDSAPIDSAPIDSATVAAISAALHRHRQQK